MVAGKFDQSVQIGVQRERRAGRERVKGRENDSKLKVIWERKPATRRIGDIIGRSQWDLLSFPSLWEIPLCGNTNTHRCDALLYAACVLDLACSRNGRVLNDLESPSEDRKSLEGEPWYRSTFKEQCRITTTSRRRCLIVGRTIPRRNRALFSRGIK